MARAAKPKKEIAEERPTVAPITARAGGGVVRVGISGWRYAGWRNAFYPAKLPQRLELQFASEHFSSIELNGSFYSLQLPSSYREWYAQTPQDFVFAVKGGRFITHMKKLREPEQGLANFYGSGVLALEEKLGPFLWQLPAALHFDAERLSQFLTLLPRNFAQAAALAANADARLKHPAVSEYRVNRPLRHALEVRHHSYLCPEFIDLLRANGVALVLADTAGIFPYAEDLTADFVYIRLHGSTELYRSGYNDAALEWWAARIRQWSAGGAPGEGPLIAPPLASNSKSRDVYVYFDNDAKVHAPYDAQQLHKKLVSPAR